MCMAHLNSEFPLLEIPQCQMTRLTGRHEDWLTISPEGQSSHRCPLLTVSAGRMRAILACVKAVASQLGVNLKYCVSSTYVPKFDDRFVVLQIVYVYFTRLKADGYNVHSRSLFEAQNCRIPSPELVDSLTGLDVPQLRRCKETFCSAPFVFCWRGSA